MEQLSKNWLTEGLIDFEYKKYILLAYLMSVQNHFNDNKLYPFFSDLLFHYKNLLHLKENKKLLYENFPKKISKADFDKLEVVYEQIINDDKIMLEIEDIISYALPRFQQYLSDGKDIYDIVDDKISISPVGLSPIDPQAGYLFVYIDNKPETKIYEYQMTIFENADEKYRGIHTQYLESVPKSLANTFETIKIDLIRKYKKLPNPGTFLVCSKHNFPFQETLFPIAKRKLIQYIAQTTY